MEVTPSFIGTVAGEVVLPDSRLSSKAINKFWDNFRDMKDQDSYDGLVAATGKLNKKEFLVLPDDFVIPNVAAEDVGKEGCAHTEITGGQWLEIYILNKSACSDPANAVKFALIRAEAVRYGWLRDGDTYEITRKPTPTDMECKIAFDNDFDDIEDHVGLAGTAAFIVPMVAEHGFRTTGHHYSTIDASSYSEHCSATLRACRLPGVATFLPPAMLYHSALHWVNHGRARDVLGALLGTKSVPKALKTRYNAAPAGTEIITQTDAVIKALRKAKLDQHFEHYGKFDFPLISNMAMIIEQDPPKYHKAYFAYGRLDLSQVEKEVLENATEEAARFAPYSRSFIKACIHQADIDTAKGLDEPAKQNPFNLRRAQNLFRRLLSDECKNFEDVIKAEFARG